MKKRLFLFMALVSLCSFSLHKFYVSINEVYFSEEKHRLEITSRIFVDDLDLALERRFGKKFYLATSQERKDSREYLQRYFDEKITFRINNSAKAHKLVLTETEENVLICYFVINEVKKVQSIEIKNIALMELYDQQHIFHTNVSGEKKSVMLTVSNNTQTLKY